MARMNKFFDFIISARTIIFSFWIILALSLSYFALQYESETSMYFAAPKGSRSRESQLVVNETYQNLTLD